MATDKLINSTQGDDIVTKLNLIATKIQAINHDVTIPSNQVTAMTGYSEPSSTSAIVVGDTLNQAIGKLEKKADNNQSNILTVANQTTMYNGLNFANVTNVSNATIDTSAGSVTETNMDSRNIFTFVMYCRNGNTNINGIYYDGTITGNGVYKIVFEKIATCDNIAFGHSGSTYDLKVTVPVTNLTNGVEYYLVINITNYTHSNNNPFSFDKCMIVPKSVWDSGFTTYQPYVMSNAEITAWILAQS